MTMIVKYTIDTETSFIASEGRGSSTGGNRRFAMAGMPFAGFLAIGQKSLSMSAPSFGSLGTHAYSVQMQ